MSGAKNCPETPRQKMIGMMYLVLTAMLALNVSADILNAFTKVNDRLQVTLQSTDQRNNALMQNLSSLNAVNPEKVGKWLDKAEDVKEKSDSIYNFLQNFKKGIVKTADGKKADPTGNTIIKKDNLDAAGQYAGISTGKARGNELKHQIEAYKKFVIKKYEEEGDSSKTAIYEKMFSTAKGKDSHGEPTDWINAQFEMMPAVAVITMLTQKQSDVRQTESDLIQYLTSKTDAKDIRVNKIEALVIPESKNVMKGGYYKAQIVLSASDTTQKPDYYLGGQKVSNVLNIPCPKIGTFPISGRIVVSNSMGYQTSYNFKDDYMVSEPSATIANVDMNVVYRGFDNKMAISVPGISSDQLQVTAINATLTKNGDHIWICHPTSNNDVTINVAAKIEDKMTPMGSNIFRVKPLPDPTAFLRITDANGNVIDYLPSSKHRLTRGELINAKMIAEYADGLLKANFSVTSFTLLISDGRGGFTPFLSAGPYFTEQQKNILLKIKPGTTIIFDKINVTGAKNTVLPYSPIKLP